MAPRIPDIVDTVRDFVNPEPAEEEEVDEKYFDRIGIAEEDAVPTLASYASEQSQVHDYDSFIREYTSQFDRTHTRDHPRNLIEWYNGDREERPRRMRQRHRPRRSSSEDSFRRVTTDTVHDEVNKTKAWLLEMILENCNHMVYELIRDMPQNIRDYEVLQSVVTMLEHYLEDMSDDIIMRYDVGEHRSEDHFGMTVNVHIELPNGHRRSLNLPIDRFMYRK